MEIIWKDKSERACIIEHPNYFLAVAVVDGEVFAKKYDNHVNNIQQGMKWLLELLEEHHG